MPALRLRAPWVLPIAGPPIADGAVLVGDDGRILAIGPDQAVPKPPGVPSERFSDAVILPGLVNAHTHLELTGYRGQVEEDDFPAWIRRIRQLKTERTPAEFAAAARGGLQACWASGVTTIADTGDSGAVIEALATAGGSGIVYHEVFGPHPAQCGESLALLEQRVRDLTRYTGDRVRLGVSPHAPYTVSGPLYRAVAAYADREDLPMAVHLAESVAETALIASGSGPFAEAWRGRGIPLPDDLSHLDRPLPIRTPVRWLEAHGVLGPETLAIHLVQVDPEDIHLLARYDVAVAHCPLSNARHGHGEAPLRQLLSAGLRVGLGTDSEASVGTLDLFAEARAARRIGDLTAAETLSLMTLDGAIAIGMEDVGCLAEGAWGDLTVLGVPAPADRVVEEAVLAAGPASVRATFLGGREVWRRA